MSPEKDNIFVCDLDMNFVRQEINDFLIYWNSKRGARKFPSRADIAPRDIQSFLPWVHMHDIASDGKEYRVRLIGTKLSETFGNRSGQSVSSLPPGVAERVGQAIDWVLEAGAPVRTYAPHAALPGQEFQGIESCFAPLSSNGTDIDMIIAVSILEKRK